MNTRQLLPFGIEITAPTRGLALDAVAIPQLRSWVGEHRLAVLRGFDIPSDEQMLAFCRQLGSILEWEFGAVNELRVRDEARNYLYTSRAVPFHWDGAFAARVPHYIFFHCRIAPPPGSGGETAFCDTPRLLQHLTPEERRLWEGVRITYSTDKVVHYGGTFVSPMLAAHPVTGETVLRFAEPVEDLNPVRLEIDGVPAVEQPAFLVRMHNLLNDPAVCYAHAWHEGDVVLADNHALLHGRSAFTQPAARHLRRVNIL
jgi:alpha-ketoglutarate-dependent taurine dioxygenase